MYNSLFFRVFMDLYSHHHSFPTLILICIHHNCDSCIKKGQKRVCTVWLHHYFFMSKRKKGIINWYMKLWKLILSLPCAFNIFCIFKIVYDDIFIVIMEGNTFNYELKWNYCSFSFPLIFLDNQHHLTNELIKILTLPFRMPSPFSVIKKLCHTLPPLPPQTLYGEDSMLSNWCFLDMKRRVNLKCWYKQKPEDLEKERWLWEPSLLERVP